MALGDPYASVAEIKAQTDIKDAVDDAYIATVASAISRQIEAHCGRQFNDAGTATARIFRPQSWNLVRVDEFHTTTGLIVKIDTGNDGTYATTLTDYNLHPLNGVVAGVPGWPFDEVEVFGGRTLPCHTDRPGVQVTARWGWASVPTDVKQAALIQAAKIFGRRYSHNGLVGSGDFVFRVSTLQLDPDVQALLNAYVRPLVA